MIAFQRKGKIILGQVPLKMSISGSQNAGVFRMCSHGALCSGCLTNISYQIGHPMQNVAPRDPDMNMMLMISYNCAIRTETMRDMRIPQPEAGRAPIQSRRQ
jgi:hypothetical protein